MSELENRITKTNKLDALFNALYYNNIKFVDASDEFLRKYLSDEDIKDLNKEIFTIGLKKVLQDGLYLNDSRSKEVNTKKINKVLKSIVLKAPKYEEGFLAKHLKQDELDYLYYGIINIGKREISNIYFLRSQEKIEYTFNEETYALERKGVNWREVNLQRILGITKHNYTQEDLSEALKRKIEFIKEHGISKEQIENDIDECLDAYNKLLKELSIPVEKSR